MSIQPILAHKVFPASMRNIFVATVLANSENAIRRNGTSADLAKAAEYMQDIATFTSKKPVFLTTFLEESNKGNGYTYHIITNTSSKPVCSFPTINVHQKPLETIKLLRDSIISRFSPKKQV